MKNGVAKTYALKLLQKTDGDRSKEISLMFRNARQLKIIDFVEHDVELLAYDKNKYMGMVQGLINLVENVTYPTPEQAIQCQLDDVLMYAYEAMTGEKFEVNINVMEMGGEFINSYSVNKL